VKIPLKTIKLPLQTILYSLSKFGGLWPTNCWDPQFLFFSTTLKF